MPTVTFEPMPPIDNVLALATAINRNLAAVEAALDRCLFRDDTLPNQLEADLNMNGRSVFNAVPGSAIVRTPADA